MTPSAPSPVRPRRSLLFVPALRPDRFARALEAGADIVCIDMDDAVAIDRKDEGRAVTLPLFRERTHPEVEQMVRINALSTYHGLKDLQALIESDAPPPAIMIPKIRSAEEVQIIDGLLSAGRARDIRFCVIIETNQGLERAIEIENANPYGNAACIYTTSGDVAQRVMQSVSAGMCGVNVGVPVPREPFGFGGWNDSLFGHGNITGWDGFLFWTRQRKITTKWALQKDWTWMS
jgi:citrate lyase beta subunit